MKPFVKWAGGKRQILDAITQVVRDYSDDDPEFKTKTYFEPFIGGGAVFFSLHPRKAVINDLNKDLINAYKVIQSDNYIDLIKRLKRHQDDYHSKDADEYYYEVRYWDRRDDFESRSDVEKAARMIFLNKTCYNGLYRVNSSGQFNTPIGRYKNPPICDESNIKEIHEYLSDPRNDIKILSGDYSDTVKQAKADSIVYVDPPYDYEDDDGFTKYQMAGFTFDDFQKLKSVCDESIDKNSVIIISNNATSRVLNLFEQDPQYKISYDIKQISTLRTINCKGNLRKTGKEVIIIGEKIVVPQANNIRAILDLCCHSEDDEILGDNKRLMELLNVNTERQVSYYLSAMLYLGFMTNRRLFTDNVKRCGNDMGEIGQLAFDVLSRKDIFKETYDSLKSGKPVDLSYVSEFIEKQEELSKSTAERRAITVKSWAEWMVSFSNSQN